MLAAAKAFCLLMLHFGKPVGQQVDRHGNPRPHNTLCVSGGSNRSRSMTICKPTQVQTVGIYGGTTVR